MILYSKDIVLEIPIDVVHPMAVPLDPFIQQQQQPAPYPNHALAPELTSYTSYHPNQPVYILILHRFNNCLCSYLKDIHMVMGFHPVLSWYHQQGFIYHTPAATSLFFLTLFPGYYTRHLIQYHINPQLSSLYNPSSCITFLPQMVGQIPIPIPNPSSASTDAVVHSPHRRL
jgi:hypothetical protein